MVDTATAQYLSDNIGGVLAKALGEMAVSQPNDGVAFLGQWLKVHIDQEEAKCRREQEEASLKEARAKAAAKLEELAAKKAAQEATAAAKDKSYQDALSKFGDSETTFQEPFWSELVSVASTLTEAQAVYVGLVDEEGLEGAEGTLIRYTEALEGSDMMREKVLMSGQGVSWGAVTENPTEEVPFLFKPPQPEPPEVNPDDPDAAPPEPTTLPYYPVSVPCVTDVKEVHYFDMTRLGAYLAVPLVYTSYYTPEAYAAAKAYEEEKKATAQKRQEAQEAYDKAVEEATANGGEEAAAAVEKPPELEPQEEKPMELPGKTVKMLLCMDTLGTNTAIEESKIELAMELCKVFGKCKEETEKKQVDTQALGDIDTAALESLAEEITAARTKAEEDTQEQLQADDAEAEDEMQKDCVQKKWAFMRAARVFAEMKDTFLGLTSWVVVPPEMLNLVAATGFMFGYKKEQLYPKRKPNLNWETLCKVLDDSFFAAIQQADVTSDRKGLEPEQKLAAIKAMLPAEFDYKALSPRLDLLHAVLGTAIAYRTAELMAKKALYERQKEDAAEGEEPLTLPPLEDADDDYEGLA